MEDDDRSAALQLSLRRSPPGPLKLRVFEFAQGSAVYSRKLAKEGAECKHCQQADPSWSGPTAPASLQRKWDVVCWSLGRGGSSVPLEEVFRCQPKVLVVDSLTSPGLKEIQKRLGGGWDTRVDLLSGRTFRDQVWWRRWAFVAFLPGPPSCSLRLCFLSFRRRLESGARLLWRVASEARSSLNSFSSRVAAARIRASSPSPVGSPFCAGSPATRACAASPSSTP